MTERRDEAGSADLLREHSVQVTAQRLAVLETVTQHPHSTASEIESLVRDRIGSISRQSVYDTLGLLAAEGIIRSIQPPSSPARYETRVDDDHHHFMCSSCGRLLDVDCVSQEPHCIGASGDPRFEVHEVEIIYRGVCRECRSATPTTNSPAKEKR